MPTHALTGAVGEFAASRHGALSRRQAASIGVTAPQLAVLVSNGQIVEAAPGVFVLGASEATWHQRVAVATLCSNEAGVAAFQCAAQLHGVDGFAEEPVVVLLAAPRRLRVEGVVTHVGPLDPIDVTVVDGIRCTAVERTLCDVGSVVPPFRLKLAFEWYWRTHRDLSRLQAAVDRLHRPGQHGTKAIQELLVEARVRGRPAESGLEVRLEAIIGDLDGLVRQHEVYDEAGRFVARTDFAIPSLRLAFEAHSAQFHSSPEAVRRDRFRHERLTAAGWRVRYITSKEMASPLALRADVGRLLRSTESPTLPSW